MRRPTSRTRRKKNTETRAAPRRVEPSRPATNPQVELEEASMSVKQLADKLHIEPARAVKQFMRRGMMVNLNDVVDFETAARTAQDLGFQVLVRKQQAAGARKAGKRNAVLEPRPPVVTIMGHVDHGKTTLLDTIRKANVTAREVGAITQHIGAYQNVVDGRPITFLDTPGHHAFTEMRARGAHATDIVVLVVAADDGVMPQTREAIDHAKAAGVPIVVAINKVDKPEANIDKTKQQLADAGLLIEEWGGDTISVPMSAKTGEGVPELQENLFLVAEIAELTADPTGNAEGVVIEAKLDKARGSLATLLVQQGTLKPGDVVLAGSAWGRIKAMFNDLGERVESAGPSTPVEVLGLTGVPLAGELFKVLDDEKAARSLAEERQQATISASRVSLSSLSSQIGEGQIKELPVVIKTDVQGSIEPIRSSLERLGSDEARVKIIRAASGPITEEDVFLASADKGIILGFNAKTAPGAQQVADREGVGIQRYDIIYRLEEDMAEALKGMLMPQFIDVLGGRAEVRAVFSAGKQAKIAGAYVLEGRVWRGAHKVKVVRGNDVVSEPRIVSLRRFKDNVNEVPAGMECGIGLDPFGDTQVGDVLELYRREKTS